MVFAPWGFFAQTACDTHPLTADRHTHHGRDLCMAGTTVSRRRLIMQANTTKNMWLLSSSSIFYVFVSRYWRQRKKKHVLSYVRHVRFAYSKKVVRALENGEKTKKHKKTVTTKNAACVKSCGPTYCVLLRESRDKGRDRPTKQQGRKTEATGWHRIDE